MRNLIIKCKSGAESLQFIIYMCLIICYEKAHLIWIVKSFLNLGHKVQKSRKSLKLARLATLHVHLNLKQAVNYQPSYCLGWLVELSELIWAHSLHFFKCFLKIYQFWIFIKSCLHGKLDYKMQIWSWLFKI